LVDRGVDDLLRRAERRCDRTVVFPAPDSPLDEVSFNVQTRN
jgi:hypothetical protein